MSRAGDDRGLDGRDLDRARARGGRGSRRRVRSVSVRAGGRCQNQSTALGGRESAMVPDAVGTAARDGGRRNHGVGARAGFTGAFASASTCSSGARGVVTSSTRKRSGQARRAARAGAAGGREREAADGGDSKTLCGGTGTTCRRAIRRPPSAAPSQPPPADAKESRDSLADAPSNRARFEAREARPAPAQSAAGLPATAAPSPAPGPPLPQAEAPPSAPGPVARSAPTQSPMLPRAEPDGRSVAMRVTARPVVDIQSPDGNVRWRLDGATVSRTSNGGATWSEQFTGTATTLTAGFSPSPTICWVVGRRGVVLLSTDSQTWRRLEFPDPAADSRSRDCHRQHRRDCPHPRRPRVPHRRRRPDLDRARKTPGSVLRERAARPPSQGVIRCAQES